MEEVVKRPGIYSDGAGLYFLVSGAESGVVHKIINSIAGQRQALKDGQGLLMEG